MSLADVPFAQSLGAQMLECGEGRAKLRLAGRDDQKNGVGTVHGGVIMALLDIVMARAVRSLKDGGPVATVEMKTSFLEGAVAPLEASGACVRNGRNVLFAEGEIVGADGRVVARASATFVTRSGAPKAWD